MMALQERTGPGNNGFTPYEIRIEGNLDGRWSEWFCGIRIRTIQLEGRPCQTSMVCSAIDQSKLRGIMNKLWDLNLCIVSVVRIDTLHSKYKLEEIAFDNGENPVQHGGSDEF